MVFIFWAWKFLAYEADSRGRLPLQRTHDGKLPRPLGEVAAKPTERAIRTVEDACPYSIPMIKNCLAPWERMAAKPTEGAIRTVGDACPYGIIVILGVAVAFSCGRRGTACGG